MDYKQILEDILELDERITIIRGFGDVIKHSFHFIPEMMFKEFTKDNYWVVMGRGSDEMIVESMSSLVCEVEREGEYEFKAVLKWVPSEYDEWGRCILCDYLEVEHIEFNFQQTFLERERHSKLDQVFNDKFEDLFN